MTSYEIGQIAVNMPAVLPNLPARYGIVPVCFKRIERRQISRTGRRQRTLLLQLWGRSAAWQAALPHCTVFREQIFFAWCQYR